VASIGLFLLYGKEKHGLKINLNSMAFFALYVAILALICLDDMAEGLNLALELPIGYWVVMEWLYPMGNHRFFHVWQDEPEQRKINLTAITSMLNHSCMRL
jgi:hypothetical protein